MKTHTLIGELWIRLVEFFAEKRWDAPYKFLIRIGAKTLVKHPGWILRGK